VGGIVTASTDNPGYLEQVAMFWRVTWLRFRYWLADLIEGRP
jgi:hypothetical protein